MRGNSKQKRSASPEWKSRHFVGTALTVTALSIIFLFAMRSIFNRIEIGAGLNLKKVELQLAKFGGMVIQSAHLQINHQDAPPEFIDLISRKVEALKGLPIWEAEINRLKSEVQAHSWVNQVQVQRFLPNRIEIHVEILRPAFVVRGNQSWSLVGETGMFLYSSRDFPGEWSEYPLILGLEKSLVGEATQMNRALLKEISWLREIQELQNTLKEKVLVQLESVRVEYDEWNQLPIFFVRWSDSSGRKVEASFLSENWRDRIQGLQFILSDTKNKAYDELRLLGHFPKRWFLELKGEPAHG